ncbi:MAG: 5'-nucleotidase C-terminal domain-containing protein [Porphyromonas sp.]|nr:5'-nucleotidase C-terminal domain-containing protein [Porphyromonas sp.]
MKRLLSIVGLALSLLASCSGTKEIELRIIHTTDTHGNLFPYDYINQQEGTGSMARFATLMQQVRQDSKHVLLLDGGDILQGEPITYYSNYIDTLRTNAVAVAMNYLAYDATTIGNHDIEPGHATYDRFVRDAKFPVLGANVINTATDEPYFVPYKVFEQGGARIVVLGLTTPAIPQWLPEHLWSGMRFDDIIESAKQWVPRLQREEKPDLLVAMIHSGLSNDNADYLENAGETLATAVPGIDLILMGHDHRQTNKWVRRSDMDSVLLVNAANHLDWASDIRIKLYKDGDKVTRRELSATFADVNACAVDTAYLRLMADYDSGVRAFLGKRVGILQEEAKASDALVGASNYLALVHQMQLATVGADISFAAPLNITANLPSGDVYVRDLFKWCPFSNHLYAMELTGAEVKGYLEHSYAGWANEMKSAEERLIAMRPDAKASDRYKTAVPTYNFSSAYGIDYTVDVSKPAGHRIQVSQMSNGQPFSLTKTYRVAINSYRAGGAGGMLTEGAGIAKADLRKRIVASSEYDQFFSLMRYIEAKGVVSVGAANNWQFVPRAWAEPAGRRDIDFILGTK